MHARILCPDNCKVFEFPDEIPDDYDPTMDFLLFPMKTSMSVKELFEKLKARSEPTDEISTDEETKKPGVLGLRRIVLIDSQWHKTNIILKDERLKKLKGVRIENYKTAFWRYQTLGDECLATIEAIFYFYKELHLAVHSEYDGEYDNLLFYYSYFYSVIQQHYKSNPARPFTHIKGYIKY
eukprot:TRINITY_DN2650_c0_g1_i1.p1 TRINITY_DN2650_c0_g1~~TRINITY_DN2650_c0_g1_i1.p1  ORF type:complete len:181 (+),score=21.98 TRINITY_DN2650_c0_g1_i1:381-923(+)